MNLNEEDFFDKIIEETDPKFKKIAADIKTHFDNNETLTVKQAEWIKNALTRNKKLRHLQTKIPEIIQEEINYALDAHPAPTLSVEDIYEIISDELATAFLNIQNRIKK